MQAQHECNYDSRWNCTGTVYNRNHNDRNFDVSHAENINADMIKQNLIIHYDAHNHPTLVNSNNSKRKSIDEHEHEIYQELFMPETQGIIDNTLETKKILWWNIECAYLRNDNDLFVIEKPLEDDLVEITIQIRDDWYV